MLVPGLSSKEHPVALNCFRFAVDPSVPFTPEVGQVSETVCFPFEPRHTFVVSVKLPFQTIPVLEKNSSIKVMLTHCPWSPTNGKRRHGVLLVKLSPRQMKCLLIAVNMMIKELRMVVVPEGQIQRVPATSFVDDDLTRFKFWFATV